MPWKDEHYNVVESVPALSSGVLGLMPSTIMYCIGQKVHQVFQEPAELQGKPKNTGVGSLSLLQDSFPT